MLHAIALGAMLILLHLFVNAANTLNTAFEAGPPPGPPFFRMMGQGAPSGVGCFRAIAQCPAGRELVLRPPNREPLLPNPPIIQSSVGFIPQEFRARRCMLRAWASVPGNLMSYPPGPPGPSNPGATILIPHEWEQVQDMAVMLLLWMEQTQSRRGRVAMPLMTLWLTVELWSGPEVPHVPWDIVTPWGLSDER
ncbi:hypothetical protein MMC27_006171 [Xylographa pallens]|nr:hypothetical protein [Xylographa pallens]